MRAAVVAFLCAAAATTPFLACGSKSGGAQCGHGTVDEGMPGDCRAARALLVCPLGDGFSCGCVTDAQSCPECPTFRGTGCQNACDANEFAVECGATPTADAGPVVVYDDPPPGCHLAAQGSGALSAYCCPCE